MSEFKLLKSISEAKVENHLTGEPMRVVNPSTGKEMGKRDVDKMIIKGKSDLDDNFFETAHIECKKWYADVMERLKDYNKENPKHTIKLTFTRPNGGGSHIKAVSNGLTFSSFDLDSMEAWWPKF